MLWGLTSNTRLTSCEWVSNPGCYRNSHVITCLSAINFDALCSFNSVYFWKCIFLFQSLASISIIQEYFCELLSTVLETNTKWFGITITFLKLSFSSFGQTAQKKFFCIHKEHFTSFPFILCCEDWQVIPGWQVVNEWVIQGVIAIHTLLLVSARLISMHFAVLIQFTFENAFSFSSH